MLNLSPEDTKTLKQIFSECLICLGWLMLIGASIHKVLQPPLEKTSNSLGVSLNDKIRVTSFYHYFYILTETCGKYLGLGVLLTDPAARENLVNLITHLGDTGNKSSVSDIKDEVDTIKNTISQNSDN